MLGTFGRRFDEFLECGPAVDWHEHVCVTPEGGLNEDVLSEIIAYSDLFGLCKLVVSLPVVSGHCDEGQMRRNNDIVYQAMQKYPGRIYGLCYLDPGLTVGAPVELERCLDGLGFVGVKLYNQYTLDDPIQDEIARQCARRGKPILMHAAKLNMYSEWQPFASHGTHFANAARKHPETIFILAHIGGGGDWCWQIKSIRPYENVLIDMSGSIHDLGMVDYAVKLLGADRVLFGTDRSFASCVGKMCSSSLTRCEKETILRGHRLAGLLH